MRIVAATPDDAIGIAEAHVRSWQHAYADILDASYLKGLSVDDRARRWTDILSKTDSRTLVAVEEGSVRGFVNVGRSRDEDAGPAQGEIWALYAAPAAWGRGVGSALMRAALDRLSADGFTGTSLWVLHRNRRGIDFYLRHGFGVEPGSLKSFELGGRQVDEVRMRRAHVVASGS